MLRLRVLGQLAASVGDVPVELGTFLQRAVVARLVAGGGHIVSADRFIEDLWREQPPPKALGALQVYISNLRRILEPGRAPRTPATVIVSAPPGYRLQLPPGAVDAWRFPRLVDEAVAKKDPVERLRTLDDALALWTGPAYAEFADEEWAVAEAAQLDELRLVAIEYRAEAAIALGRHAEVVAELDRHVGGHPLRENAVRLLALAYYRAGRQPEALAVIRRTRETLAEELGVDPGPALRTLESDILHQTETIQFSPPPEPIKVSPKAADSGEIVGREAELDRLARAAEQATGGFRVAWLGGDAGSGKSTVAVALARRLASQGWTTAAGRCPETVGGVPPAWAWSEVLRGLVPGRPPAPALLPKLAPLLTDDAEPVGQFWLARAVGDYLAELAAPLLVVLEDVHRADDETLHLLRHLATRLAGTPVLVLLTHRPDEATTDLMATGAALAAQTAEHLTLGGLGEEEIARLVLDRSGVAVGPATLTVLAERTGGNPLFVSETARLLAAEGVQAVHRLPPGVRDVIRRRIARLPATAQTTLRDAAVVGRDADADVLIAMRDADEDTVLDGLEAGVLSGLLTEPNPGQVRFAHVLVRETLYEDIPRLRRTRLHGKVVDALEATRPGDVGSLAHHALAAATAATAARAVGYAARAAEKASSLYAHREAVTLLRGAVEIAPEDAGRLDLQCRLVSALAHAGDLAGAKKLRSQALPAARRLGDPARLARLVTSIDVPLIWSIVTEHVLDLDMIEAIQDALPDADDAMRCRLLVALCNETEPYGGEQIERDSAEAIEIAGRLGDPMLLCMAYNARYWVCVHAGQSARLDRLADDVFEVAEANGLQGYLTLSRYMKIMVALARGDRAQARHYATLATGSSTSGQFAHILGVFALLDTLDLYIEGRFDEAEHAVVGLAGQLAAIGDGNAVAYGLMARLAIGITRGDTGTLIDDYEAVWKDLETVHEIYSRALVSAGRLDEARARWQPDEPPFPGVYQSLVLTMRAQTAMALGHRRAAKETYEQLRPLAGEMAGLSSGSVTHGPVDHFLGDLARYLGDEEAAVRHYAAAAEIAERVGSAFWAGRAREALTRR
ncbi:BTAD domain-containing putative transcriptional regulator [Herbidospora cretacea]|uniref:BTAD domain-containing putative transcriptional regulator n=1 Tax=Herbidospora cretacea TaxID=28444 RepID=UPI00077301E3|nr:BTAD domain-containing putative transcriptional regulator [Herbidospora cretacea]